jgi:hypothetical protein
MKNIFNKGRFINIYRKILYEMFLEQEVGSARHDFFTYVHLHFLSSNRRELKCMYINAQNFFKCTEFFHIQLSHRRLENLICSAL